MIGRLPDIGAYPPRELRPRFPVARVALVAVLAVLAFAALLAVGSSDRSTSPEAALPTPDGAAKDAGSAPSLGHARPLPSLRAQPAAAPAATAPTPGSDTPSGDSSAPSSDASSPAPSGGFSAPAPAPKPAPRGGGGGSPGQSFDDAG